MKKGNALVEFVLLLPLIVFMFTFTFDYIRINNIQTKMNGIINEIVVMYNDGKTIIEMENHIKETIPASTLTISNDNEYVTLIISSNIDYLTPGFEKITKSNNKIETNRKIYIGKKE